MRTVGENWDWETTQLRNLPRVRQRCLEMENGEEK